jgi:uncharacterized membrane protein/glutaredoxin
MKTIMQAPTSCRNDVLHFLRRRLAPAALASALVLAPFLMTTRPVHADVVVRGVFFSSPTCPHCRKVKQEVFPAIAARYRHQVKIALISTATKTGLDLYWSAFHSLGVQRRGVPLLVVGKETMVGFDEIDQKLPPLVDRYLAEGGVAWPDIPGLTAVLPVPSNPTPTPTPSAVSFAPSTPLATRVPPMPAPSVMPLTMATPAATPVLVVSPKPLSAPNPHVLDRIADSPRVAPVPTTTPAADTMTRVTTPESARDPEPALGEAGDRSESSSPPSGLIYIDDEPLGIWDRIAQDPIGNGLSILVLLWMLVTAVQSIVVLLRRGASAPETCPISNWLPVLAVLGLIVAAYLAQVEVREIDAVCGPVGDCNTVQQSDYARLFGVLPIGVLGVAGYIAILIAWLIHRMTVNLCQALAGLALLGMTTFGVLFSIYLTFLEPFVIGATCAWCLSSAVIMTLLFRLTWPMSQNVAGRPR